MQPQAWPRFHESLRRTLVRNLAIAGVVGAAAAAARRDPRLLLYGSILALWFSLGGHYVEVLFLNGIRPRIPRSRAAQVAARVVTWFAGGSILYVFMAATARALPLRPPAFDGWWRGGLLLVGVELTVHAILRLRGVPGFYDGRG